MGKSGSKTWTKIGLVAAVFSGLLLVGAVLLRWLKRDRPADAPPLEPEFQFEGVASLSPGLSETEAESRLPEMDPDTDYETHRKDFLQNAIRQNLFTIFNFNIFAMILMNLLLDNPVGALLNLLLLALSLTIRVGQIMLTKKRMDSIVKTLRPQAAVLRDGRLRSIDPTRIVPGDMLTVAKGDEILVSGVLAGKEAVIIEVFDPSGAAERQVVQPGEALPVGSYCVQGRGLYRAAEGGWARYEESREYQLELMKSERTPIQSVTESVLRVLLAVVLILSTALIADAVLSGTSLVSPTYRSAFSIIFGIAPAGLFMTLILKNIVGVFRISMRGALVYDPRSIEALAQVKTLCISKSSLVSGMQVNLELVGSPDGESALSENIVRQILGDMVHSTGQTTSMMQMLAETLPGEWRTVKEIAPHFARQGWYGVTFSDPDRKGTYILGQEEILSEHLVKDKKAIGERVEETVTDARRGMGRFFLRFSRTRDEDHDSPSADGTLENTAPPAPGGEIAVAPALTETEPEQSAADDAEPGFRARLGERLFRLLLTKEDLEEIDQEEEAQPAQAAVLLAYLPEPAPLFGRSGQPQIPNELIPLARVQASEIVRPEAQKTLRKLYDQGLKILILAADPPEKVVPITEELGVSPEALRMFSGQEFMEAQEAVQLVDIVGGLTPARKAQIVQSLRVQDEYVMMIGSEVSDMLALRQAFLSVVPKNGAQAALGLTDIVLLDDSLAALPRVLSTGQQMINGVLTTFKLFLSQAMMQLLLICLMLVKVLDIFPYHPSQSGVATAFTIVIPNSFLVVWASARRLTRASMRRQLLQFLIPTALALTVLVSAVFVGFELRTGDYGYARLAVAYTLLLAGWMRVLFVEPPQRFWAGGTALRGDMRVYGVVAFCAVLLLGFLIFPFFQDSFKITALASWGDFFTVAGAVILWGGILKAVWMGRNKF